MIYGFMYHQNILKFKLISTNFPIEFFIQVFDEVLRN